MEYREELDVKILSGIKDKIQGYLGAHAIDNDKLKVIRAKMDSIQRLVAEQSDSKRLPKMQNRRSKNEIMIRRDLFVEVDKNGSPMGFKKEISRLIESQLGHELIHAAATNKDGTGFSKSLRRNSYK